MTTSLRQASSLVIDAGFTFNSAISGLLRETAARTVKGRVYLGSSYLEGRLQQPCTFAVYPILAVPVTKYGVMNLLLAYSVLNSLTTNGASGGLFVLSGRSFNLRSGNG